MAEKKEYSPEKKAYNAWYEKEYLKRIPLNVQKSEYEEIKSHAAARKEPVNRFIKRAIKEQIKRDLESDPPKDTPTDGNSE